MTALMPTHQSLIPDPQPPTPISALRAVGNALVTALLAPACAVCDAVLDAPLSGCVCRSCWNAVRPITPPVCDACGDPLASRDPPTLHSEFAGPAPECRSCRSRRRVIARSRAIGQYEGALRELVHALKYGGRRSLARPLAALMRSSGAELLDAADAIVPVPLHWRREHRRGFNQARELARFLERPMLDVLMRARHTRPQVELVSSERKANVRGAFRLKRRGFGKRRSIVGLKVVLVDDVSTTGATLEECARVLRDAGASTISALTAARVVGRPARRQR